MRGVINTRKNLLLLLEAMQDLKAAGKTYKLDIVGDFEEGDSYREDIKKFIDENNLGSTLPSRLEISKRLDRAVERR